MAKKRNPGKFTIGLNTMDPSHRQVIDILNQQGRRKAQFIVNAVLHYLNCPETPEIPQPSPMDSRVIEEIVLRILRREISSVPESDETSEGRKLPQKSESLHTGGMEALLGKNGFSTIADTLAAFRNE
ncbi:hypothetical protein [Caproicibacter sp. BJN0012]|uniref:hypothetical protein n=1 Tax=Caproicibacter sp. BJN0012 TaxID=3110227 RepID=UPI002E105B49